MARDAGRPFARDVRVLPTPGRALYRLGHAPDPLAWPPWEVVGRNRFDDPHGRFRVLYAAERRRCCFAEALAPFRSELPALGAAPPGSLPPARPLPTGWLANRRLGRLRLAPGQRWLDLRAVETREALRAILAPLVLGVGMADLDGAAVRSPERRLTRAIAGWAHDAGFQGIVYTSRLDDRWACWAIFEGAELVPVGAPRPIRRGDRDLLATAALFHLAV